MIKTLRVFFIFDGFSKKGEGEGGRGIGLQNSVGIFQYSN